MILLWWWEGDVTQDLQLLGALHAGVERFAIYLGAGDVRERGRRCDGAASYHRPRSRLNSPVAWCKNT